MTSDEAVIRKGLYRCPGICLLGYFDSRLEDRRAMRSWCSVPGVLAADGFFCVVVQECAFRRVNEHFEKSMIL